MNRSIHNTIYITQKRGFTIIELTISIVILATIMAVTNSILITGIKNYQINFQKSVMQKEINFTIDSITNDVKNGAQVIASKDDFITSSNTIIIATPAIDSNDNFIYNGEITEFDYIVYYFSNGSLRKHTYGNALGKKSSLDGNDHEIISDVESVVFDYRPGIGDPSQIKITLNLSKMVSKTNVSISEDRVANLRNKQ